VAKLDGPLFSLAAHGKFAKCLTYSRRPGVNVARFQRKQKDYKTDAQAIQRQRFLTANAIWRNLTPEQKEELKKLM